MLRTFYLIIQVTHLLSAGQVCSVGRVCVYRERGGGGICSVGRVEEGGDVLKTFYPVILTIHR